MCVEDCLYWNKTSVRVFRDQLHCPPIKETATHNHQPVCTQGHPRPKIPSGHHLFPERKTLAFRRRYLRKPHSNGKRGLRSDSPATDVTCIFQMWSSQNYAVTTVICYFSGQTEFISVLSEVTRSFPQTQDNARDSTLKLDRDRFLLQLY
jgi:hypothetical protein